MENRVDYSQLRSMQELRQERLRVKVELERRKRLIGRDMERVEELLTPQFWMDQLSLKLAEMIEEATAQVASRIRGFSSTLGFLSDLVLKLTRGFRRPAPASYHERTISRRYKPSREVYYEEDDFDPDEDFAPEETFDNLPYDGNRSC
jgi:uncharacterized protein YcgL (UPF0745 family)